MSETIALAPGATLACAGLVATVAALMTVATSGRAAHRGYRQWVAAQALLAVGLAIPLVAGGLAAAVGQALLLAWPSLVLLGLRRFQGRQPLPGTGLGDAAVLVVALLVAAAGPALEAAAVTSALAMTLVHGHLAFVVGTSAAARESVELRVLAASAALAALLHLAIGLRLPVPAPAALAVAVPALLAVVTGFITLQMTHERTVGELRDSRRRLRHLANFDMLTQVPNRRHFGELARRVLQRQPARGGAVLMFDIDHFKRINDEQGHAAGDRALRLVSQCVQETLRADDVAGRHGGDEFVILLPGTELRDAMQVATRIVRAAQERATRLEMPTLSMSFGMVQLRGEETLDDAIRRADQALYEAKRQGRGRAVSADGDESHPVFVESRRLGLV